ncbi:MAG TPA: hemerythrin domain-containing protein [Candidatus Binatia bacterium]|nr:hemerythrin domain-containing protein [Candidatus Binatia bacterium]
MFTSAQQLTRRELIAKAASLATAAVVAPEVLSASGESREAEVTATEDLMREHGVLRRALLVYTESIPLIRRNAASLDAGALYRNGVLFRDFGENYHEKMLEEQHIFPVVHKSGGPIATLTDILLAQHERGREITSYLLAVTKSGRIATANAEPLARSLEAFVLMYRNHAAREDTIVFPAWKKHFSEKQLDELSDQFEDIERKMFGKDGFDDAVEKIGAIEAALGFADLSQFTAPPPQVVKG